MLTGTVDVADALPVQPDIVTALSTVVLSPIATSVPLVCAVQVPAGLTCQANVAEPDLVGLELSVAVTVTDELPAVVGVPEIVPVEALIDRPAGKPVADHA